ncbi:MAG: hypothetical protein JXA72_03630 [Bacteroidales bacterium]|nr:hypothetical protein [Bacteroidales bacterium]
MKKTIVEILVLSVIALFYACNTANHQMYTRINPDGSCYREFKGSADSASVAGDTSKNRFPVKLDSSWKMRIYGKHAGDSILKQIDKQDYFSNFRDSTFLSYLIVQKEFPSVKNMADNFRFNNSDWDSVMPVLSWKKKFRWFYTYYEFSETYPSQNPFATIPVGGYLSPEEIATLYGHHSELYKGKIGIEIRDMLNDMESRSNAWLNRSEFEENYRFLQKHYSDLKNIPVDSAAFSEAKDSVYLLFGKDTLLPDVNNRLDSVLNIHFDTRNFSNDAFFPSELMEKFEKEIPDYQKSFGMKLDYRLTLPGKVVETNAPFLTNDTLTWKVDAYRFFFTDYTLRAASRKPNYWAFAVTAVILILSVLTFLVKRK